MGAFKKLILVEGKNDQHAIGHLLHYHNIDCIFVNNEKENLIKIKPEDIGIKEVGGIDRLLKNLDIYLDDGELENLAIIFDADKKLIPRWNKVRSMLEARSSGDLPNIPSEERNIFDLTQVGRVIRVGIWIMPDNKNSGFLEDFLEKLVPKTDGLWEYVQTCVEGINEKLIRFSEEKTSKVNMYTWLAWQEEPGQPYGIAIKAKYLDAQVDECISFATWIRGVFDLSQ